MTDIRVFLDSLTWAAGVGIKILEKGEESVFGNPVHWDQDAVCF